jgi:hypothetical protein
MARMHGSHGQIAMGTPGSPAGDNIIGSLNKWTLNMARDRVDVTCFGDTNKQYVQGLPNIQGTIGGFWDTDHGSPTEGNFQIFDVAEGDTAVDLVLVPSTLDPTHAFRGRAYLDASIDVSASGAVSISGSFVAAGPWNRT